MLIFPSTYMICILKFSDIHAHSNRFLGSYEKISYSKANVTFVKFRRKKSCAQCSRQLLQKVKSPLPLAKGQVLISHCVKKKCFVFFREWKGDLML